MSKKKIIIKRICSQQLYIGNLYSVNYDFVAALTLIVKFNKSATNYSPYSVTRATRGSPSQTSWRVWRDRTGLYITYIYEHRLPIEFAKKALSLSTYSRVEDQLGKPIGYSVPIGSQWNLQNYSSRALITHEAAVAAAETTKSTNCQTRHFLVRRRGARARAPERAENLTRCGRRDARPLRQFLYWFSDKSSTQTDAVVYVYV